MGVCESTGAGVDVELTAKSTCTSCHEGEGLELLHGHRDVGRCVPCHSSCADCHLGNDESSCLACKEPDDILTILDAASQTGSCGATSCPGCITRAESATSCPAEAPVFVAAELGATEAEDLGRCQGYTGDCTVSCVPDDDSEGTPARRVCTKHCYTKSVKRTKAGDKKILVCRMRKTVTCVREEIISGESTSSTSSQLSTKALGESAVSTGGSDGGGEILERCNQEKEAECAAALDFSEAKNIQTAHTIMTEASLNTTASAPGCETIGDQAETLQVCESNLVMF